MLHVKIISMVDRFCCDAICLRVIEFSETSQIVSLFTPDHGIVSMIAKGIRRIPKKTSAPLMAPLDILSAGQVVFIPSRHPGQLATLTAWDVTNHRPELRRNLEKILAGELLAEVTLAAWAAEDASKDVFHQLGKALDELSHSASMRIVVSYLKHLLAAAGYALDFSLCTHCRKPLGDHGNLLRGAAGLFCDRCAVSGRLARADRRVLAALQRLGPPDQLTPHAPGAQPDAGALLQAAQLLICHLRLVLDHDLHFDGYLRDIFQFPAGSALRQVYAHAAG